MIDFTLQNLIRIRLINPTEYDISRIRNKLGLEPEPFDPTEQADITIEYHDRITTGDLTLLGQDSSGYDEKHFYILNVRNKATKVLIPFDQVGSRLHIQAEKGVRHVPLLNHIVNFRLIAKGYIPVHASAFVYNGHGILVPGWKTGGKTEALLSFASHGALYVGDEWVVISGDGRTMFGIPGPTSIKDWQFQYLEKLLPKIALQDRLKFKTIHLLNGVHKLMDKIGFGKSFLARNLEEMLPSFNRQLKIWKEPRQLFKDQYCHKPVSLDKIFLIQMHSDQEIFIERADAGAVAEKMIHTYDFEQGTFFDFYNAFKFAFPDRANDFLENVKEREAQLLRRAFSGKETYKVYRPHPVSFPELFQKMSLLCLPLQFYSKAG